MRYKEVVYSYSGLGQVFSGGEAVIKTLEPSAARLGRPKSSLRPSRRLCRERASSQRSFSFCRGNRTKYEFRSVRASTALPKTSYVSSYIFAMCAIFSREKRVYPPRNTVEPLSEDAKAHALEQMGFNAF